MRILAIDIGGTKSAMGICQLNGTQVTSIEAFAKLPSSDFTSLPAMIKAWQDKHPSQNFDAIGAGVAGPVIDSKVHLTNLGWNIDAETITQSFKKPFRICNDMESHGWGIIGLDGSQRLIINQGRAAPGPMALIAAGTGLGESIIGWNGKTHHPMAGEGGHASFSPTNELEDELLAFLRRDLKGHVSWERILGGRDGFRHLSRFIADHRGIKLPGYLSDLPPTKVDWGEAIITADGTGDPFAQDVLALYSTLYGREAANLALKCVPRSGVYLGGGIAPKITSALKENFMHGFADKGRFAELLRSVPVFVIIDDMNGLKGAAIQFSANY